MSRHFRPESRSPAQRVPPAIVIGGSAGALEVILQVLSAIPPGPFPPVVIVVHLPRRKQSILADVLGGRCGLPVREPIDKEPLAPGTVYVAPPDYHLLIEQGPAFALSADEPLFFSMPAIDVLFESAAEVMGERLVGILLTGASEDGARGVEAVLAAGGTAIIQAPGDSSVRTMPEAAIGRNPRALVLPIRGISDYLNRLAVGPNPGSPSSDVR